MKTSSAIIIGAVIGAIGTISGGFIVNPSLLETFQFPPDFSSNFFDKMKFENKILEIRKEHQVRSMEDLENELQLNEIANGVYGFISPSSLDLYTKYNFQPEISKDYPNWYPHFEIHKISDGSVIILGYCSEETFIKFEKGELTTFQFFVEPWPEYNKLLLLSLSQISESNSREYKDSYLLDITIN